MQYEGDMRPISGPTGSLDATAISDIQKHLKVSSDSKSDFSGHKFSFLLMSMSTQFDNHFFRINKKELIIWLN